MNYLETIVLFLQNALRLLGYHLGLYSHSLCYKRTVIRVISTVAMSGNSSLLIIPALKTLRDIYEAMASVILPLKNLCEKYVWQSTLSDFGGFEPSLRM